MNPISRVKNFLSTLRGAFFSGFAFALGVLCVSVGYAAFSSDLSASDRVSTWTALSSASWNRVVDALIELGGRPVGMAFFESAELPAVVGTATVSHWLGWKPKLWSVVLRCKTAELGHSVGDEIDVTDNGFYNWYHYFASADATNVTSMIGGTLYVWNRTTGSISAITPANWKLVIRAWR